MHLSPCSDGRCMRHKACVTGGILCSVTTSLKVAMKTKTPSRLEFSSLAVVAAVCNSIVLVI